MSPNHDHIWLILIKDVSDMFYLEIPLGVINTLCLTPRKYLLYLGWCILGVDVDVDSLGLALEDADWNLNEIGTDGDVEGASIYSLIIEDLVVVDIEVIKSTTAVPSETTHTRKEFRERLLRRDKCCVCTGIEPELGDSLHIIPYKRGSEWFRLIIDNRPHEDDDDITGLVDINDARNGFFATKTIHPAFDGRSIAILKTPNRILDIDDIPPRPDRLLPDNIAYPVNGRYTVQWLKPPSEIMQHFLPDNTDITFGKHARANKPSALLLHYNYGAAAVKFWGRGAHVIEDLAKRPDPIPSKMTPAIRKRKKAQADAEKAKKQKTAVSQGSKRNTWDEDDVMLFFWGNSRLATDRYIKTREAKKKNFEQWRQGVESAL